MSQRQKIDPRFAKALKIYGLPDCIMQDKDSPFHFLVRAETDPVLVYSVTFIEIHDENGKVIGLRGRCECIDYMYQSKQNIDHKCKHILVYFIAKDRGKRIKKVNVQEYYNPS